MSESPLKQNKIVALDNLIPYPDNYRQHPDEQIQKLVLSLQRFGQGRSIVVQDAPGKQLIVAGHGIVEAAKLLDWPELRADILPADWTPEQVKGYLIADNQHVQGATDDDEILARLLQEQQDLGIDLASLGTDDETLRQMLESLGDEYLQGDEDTQEEDEAPDVEEEQTRVRLGDVWQLGKHKIACCDSTNAEHVKQLLGAEKISMVWADPPYGVAIVDTKGWVSGGEAYDYPFGGVTKARGDVGGGASHMRKTGKPYIADKGLRGSVGASKPFGTVGTIGRGMKAKPIIEAGKYAPVIGDDSTVTAISSYRLASELYPKAVHIWWGGNYYAYALPPSSCWIVWDKENDESFFADCELAWTNQKTAVRIFRHMWNGLMKDSERGERRIHPTQKPCALAEWCFDKYGKENDVIYDPFLGSGISVIAAEKLGRTVYGCELSPAYINAVIERWEKHTGHTAQLLDRVEVAHV